MLCCADFVVSSAGLRFVAVSGVARMCSLTIECVLQAGVRFVAVSGVAVRCALDRCVCTGGKSS